MEKMDMMDQEIWEKRRQLEELEEDYYYSRKKIENEKEECDYRFYDLQRMLEEKYTLVSHILNRIEGDTSDLRYQLNQIATDCSQQMNMAYRKRCDQLEDGEIQLKQKYHQDHRILDEELTLMRRKQRDMEERRGNNGLIQLYG